MRSEPLAGRSCAGACSRGPTCHVAFAAAKGLADGTCGGNRDLSPECVVDAAEVWQSVGGGEEHRGQALALPGTCKQVAARAVWLWPLCQAGQRAGCRPSGDPAPVGGRRSCLTALLPYTLANVLSHALRPRGAHSLPRRMHSPTQSPSSSSSAVMRPSSPECSFRRRSSASTMGLATLPGKGGVGGSVSRPPLGACTAREFRAWAEQQAVARKS